MRASIAGVGRSQRGQVTAPRCTGRHGTSELGPAQAWTAARPRRTPPSPVPRCGLRTVGPARNTAGGHCGSDARSLTRCASTAGSASGRLRTSWDRPISTETVDDAARHGHYRYLAHALAGFDLMDADPIIEGARTIRSCSRASPTPASAKRPTLTGPCNCLDSRATSAAGPRRHPDLEATPPPSPTTSTPMLSKSNRDSRTSRTIPSVVSAIMWYSSEMWLPEEPRPVAACRLKFRDGSTQAGSPSARSVTAGLHTLRDLPTLLGRVALLHVGCVAEH